MDLEEIANCLNTIMDDFLMEYKEMEHELDSTRKNPVMGEKYSQLLPGDLICECQFSCGWRQLIVVCVRNLMKFRFGYQSSACPPGRITREAVLSLECVQSSARPPGRIVREAVSSSEYSEHLLVLDEPQAMRSYLLLCEYYDRFIDPWIKEHDLIIVGGCCGIMPEHIRYISENL